MYSNQFVQLKFLYKNYMVNQKLGYSNSLTVRLYTFSKLILKNSSLMQNELLHSASAHENEAFLCILYTLYTMQYSKHPAPSTNVYIQCHLTLFLLYEMKKFIEGLCDVYAFFS